MSVRKLVCVDKDVSTSCIQGWPSWNWGQFLHRDFLQDLCSTEYGKNLIHLVKNAPVSVKLPRRPSIPFLQTTSLEEEKIEEEVSVEEEVAADDDDDDDVFENTYANIEPVKKVPPKQEQTYTNVEKEKIYANVQNITKEKIKEITPRKFKKLSTKAENLQERRPQTPVGLDLSAIEDDELFSASEVVEMESEDGMTISSCDLPLL